MKNIYPKEGLIGITGMRFFAYHGVHPIERTNGNNFIVDVYIKTEMRVAVEEDDLDGTVDYSLVYKIVKSQMLFKCSLLEHLAGKIISNIVEEFPYISHIQVKVTKENPPMEGNVAATFVELEKKIKK
ncbi:MAG: dihydroneopterin aldolase [Chitinophagaceae bacterium]|nr:MAG: dihydroneopterin aldolase [Chitinophagaceae bacterium]